ncbi:MAG: AEC family transporter [Hyphomicrobiaceae bacterium]|nr:AEC family transporter [Hyphomicrobiaceae bacterium]
MSSVISIVAPVFALILIGFLSVRFGVLSETSGRGVADFVFKIAIPAMLFRTMVLMRAPEAPPTALWASFFGAVAIVWILATLGTRLLLRRSSGDAAVISMCAGFGNVVMLGIPLSLSTLGNEASVPIALIITLSAPTLWFAATLQIEWAERRQDASLAGIVRDFALSLLKNPIVMAVLLGSLWRLTGLGLGTIAGRITEMLAMAAVPGALVALGLSLAGFEIKGQAGTLSLMLVLKLVALPVVAWALVTFVFTLPKIWAGVVIIFAACPSGANAFLFASRYDRVVNSVSGAVALGTALSALTISFLLFALGLHH